MNTIGVIGAGSWGTALAKHLAQKGYEVYLWVREPEVLSAINEKHENTVFLPEICLPDNIHAKEYFEIVSYMADMILMVVPSQYFREVFEKLVHYLDEDKPVISATKGIDCKTLQLMSEIVKEIAPNNPFACISGPSFAKEVARQQPTAVTIASKDKDLAEGLQQIFATDYFRPYTSDDVKGVEAGGSLKNIIAIATGISDGLNLGLNARSALITRGLAEITRLGVKIGANPLTFLGLSGIGDLVLTCTGDLSRNRNVGLKIGQGMRLEEIISATKMIAEGIKTSLAARELASRLGIETPITTKVCNIIEGKETPRKAVVNLMKRKLKAENIKPQ